MPNISLILAFSAGLLTFLSPCILPIIPGYISYLTGLTSSDLQSQDMSYSRWRIFSHSIFFIIGFSLLFIILGAAASSLGQLFYDYQPIIRKVGAVVLFMFSLKLLGVLKLSILNKSFRFLDYKKKSVSYLGSFIVGITFSAAWTACATPILASILLLAGTTETLSLGILYLIFFSLGLAVPFLITGFFLGEVLKRMSQFTKYMHWVEVLSGGVLLVISGVLFFN